jgi:hypothetical protein
VAEAIVNHKCKKDAERRLRAEAVNAQIGVIVKDLADAMEVDRQRQLHSHNKVRPEAIQLRAARVALMVIFKSANIMAALQLVLDGLEDISTDNMETLLRRSPRFKNLLQPPLSLERQARIKEFASISYTDWPEFAKLIGLGHNAASRYHLRKYFNRVASETPIQPSPGMPQLLLSIILCCCRWQRAAHACNVIL